MICKIRLGILVILTCCVTSCAVIKDTQLPVLNKIDNQTFSKSNGKFSNNPTQSEASSYSDLVFPTYGPVPFYAQIEGNNPVGSKTDWKKQSIKVEFISTRKGYISLYEMDTLKAKKTIRGKIKNGYFYRRPYFIGIPLFPLFFGYRTYRYRIGITENSLVVDYRWNFWAFALFGGNKGKGQTHSVFKRIE